MLAILVLFSGASSDQTCSQQDSEVNVCLLALNASRSTVEATSVAGSSRSNGSASASSDLHNATDLSLAGHAKTGVVSSLGNLVSDYRSRSARGSTNRGGGNSTLAVNSSDQDAGVGLFGGAAEKAAAAQSSEPIVPEHFGASNEGSAMEHNLMAKAKTAPSPLTSLRPPPLPGYSSKESGENMEIKGKGYLQNSYADQLEAAKRMNSMQDGAKQQHNFGTMTSSSSDLQEVLKQMLKLGTLIKRMPDDKLHSSHETPSPTPPPYAFARRFEPFGKGTSSI